MASEKLKEEQLLESLFTSQRDFAMIVPKPEDEKFYIGLKTIVTRIDEIVRNLNSTIKLV